jgi:pilus assembly protein Flp/PilA
MFKKIWNDESGVAMTEYIIILVLVAVAAIAVVSVFGKQIKTLFTNSTDSLNSLEGDSKTKTGQSGLPALQ